MEPLAGAALSPQQSRCLQLVGEGLTTKEIAFALALSENTVDEHVKKAMTKLGAPNRMRAAALHRAAQALVTASMSIKPRAERATHPQLLGGGISPVSLDEISAPGMASTLLLRDGDYAPFEGFPPLPMPQRQPSKPESDRDVQDRLKIISKVLTIAGAIALILVATPALIDGAEHIATWLRITTHAQP